MTSAILPSVLNPERKSDPAESDPQLCEVLVIIHGVNVTVLPV